MKGGESVASGTKKELKHINRLGEEIFGNETELEMYQKCEKRLLKNIDIETIEYQKKYILIPKMIGNNGDEIPETVHILDFELTLKDGSRIVIDTKGGAASQHEKDSKLKRKLWMSQNPGIPYYMISRLPKYLGGYWVDTTPRRCLYSRVEKLYCKLYPWVVRYYQNKKEAKKNFIPAKNFPQVVAKNDKQHCPSMPGKLLYSYYEIFAVCGLFYTFTGKLKVRKIEALENPYLRGEK